MSNNKTALGNIFGGLLDGVKTHVLGEGEQPTQPKQEAQFPSQADGNDPKETEVKVFGMKPVTLGLVTVGVIGASVLGVYLYRKYGKK